jgi:UDP-galactopyranose mutase
MITIIGAGLAGLSAAYHSDMEYLLLEREKKPGGLSRSIEINGFVFDYAPHILFTRDPYIMQLYKDLLKDNWVTQIRKAFIYMKGVYIKYPFEANLAPLPKKIIIECIEGVKKKPEINPTNFEEWIYTTFGDGIAKHYMIPYNQKIWKYPLSKINTDWIIGRVPSPSLEDMKKGVEGKQDIDFGPNAVFHYPKCGGIGKLAEEMAKKIRVCFEAEVTRLKKVQEGVETFFVKNGYEKKSISNRVLSSLPLPELVKILDEVPTYVTKAASNLVYNSIVCINLGIDRQKITDKHWLYFPENDVVFNRVSFPMNFSPYTTPKGKSSLLVEVTFRDEVKNLEEITDIVLDDLVKINILNENEKVEVCDSSIFQYAYVIYDMNHQKNVTEIHKYLLENNIIPIGRFGEWEYFNMDKAIQSGKNGINRIRKK